MTNMSPSGFIVKHVILHLVVIILLVDCSVVRLVLDKEDTNNIILKHDRVIVPAVVESSSRQTPVLWAQQSRKRTIKHFAVHGICHSRTGRRHLYLALKSKLCHTRGLFISSLVQHLCIQRGRSLTNWVSELFDVDGDGYITHYERKLYG